MSLNPFINHSNLISKSVNNFASIIPLLGGSSRWAWMFWISNQRCLIAISIWSWAGNIINLKSSFICPAILAVPSSTHGDQSCPIPALIPRAPQTARKGSIRCLQPCCTSLLLWRTLSRSCNQGKAERINIHTVTSHLQRDRPKEATFFRQYKLHKWVEKGKQ